MICFSRIDDRLIHGQVATTWVRASNANRIYVVDDITAADAFMVSLFKGIAPEGTKIEVWDVATACEKVRLVHEHPQIRGFVLARGPIEFLKMAQAGVPFSRICIGNMAPKEGRTQLQQKLNTWATPEEKEAFRQLVGMGVDVYIQHIPDHPKTPVLNTEGMKQ